MKIEYAFLAVFFITCGCVGSVERGGENLTVTAAIAAALEDAGVTVAVNVPATGVTEVYDAFCELTGQSKTYSYNEEVAYTVAHGAALGGARSAAILKSHGFAKAANSVIDSITAGTNAGFVALVFDDKTGAHSDNIFDTLSFIAGTKIVHVVPNPDDMYYAIVRAFETSEKYRVPVAVMVDSADLSRTVGVRRAAVRPVPVGYVRDVYRHLLCPLLAPYQHALETARLTGRTPRIPKPELPKIPDGLPPHFKPTALQYAGVFDAFKKIRGADAVTTGDPGTSALFAFPPYDCVDVVTYYGGGIPLAVGFYLAGRRNVWAVSGDYSFIAASNLGLAEAVQRGIPLRVIVFNNGIAAATGGQPIGPDVFGKVIGGYAGHTRYVKHDDPDGIEKALNVVKNSKRLEIVVVEVPE